MTISQENCDVDNDTHTCMLFIIARYSKFAGERQQVWNLPQAACRSYDYCIAV